MKVGRMGFEGPRTYSAGGEENAGILRVVQDDSLGGVMVMEKKGNSRAMKDRSEGRVPLQESGHGK